MSADVLAAIPHVVIRSGMIVGFSEALRDELDADPVPLLGPLDGIGTRLDDTSYGDVALGRASLRVRLGRAMADRPVRLRRLGGDGDRAWIEVRSLAAEFRLEALLRRSGMGHMLISPTSWVNWSVASDELLELMPGDDPIKWVELMDPDDMQAIMLAVHDVANDPSLQRTVTHRLIGDDRHVVVDTIESVLFDPDLRGVLMRSRVEHADAAEEPDLAPIERDAGAPWAGATVSDHLPIGVIVASREGKVLHRNAVASELIGVRRGQRLLRDGDGPWLLARLEPSDVTCFVDLVEGAATGRSGHCTIPSPVADGRWLRVSVSPSAATTMVITVEDVTELTEAEQALRASNRLLEALDSHSEDIVLVFDSDGQSRYASSSIRRRLGDVSYVQRAEEFLPFIHAADRTVVADLIRRVRLNPDMSEQIEFRIDVGNESTPRWHQATMTNLLDDPDVRGFVVTLRDVHERHLVERDLRFRATHDALTTLPDRAALQAQLESTVAEARVYDRRVALMFCDIDHFKLINDRAGHHVGDLVLTEVAARLRSALRSSDVVGRFGGDEFVIVVPTVDDEAHAVALAERIFDVVSGPTRCDGIDIDIAVSVGVAVSDDDCDTSAALLQRADLAMYEAKAQGRGRVSLFVPSTSGANDRETLRADLRQAISGRDLTMHYQPVVPLHDAVSGGAEAFARWEHAALGLVEARRFIGIAEGAGLMPDLGHALVDLVGRDLAELDALAGDDQRFVCLNISPAQVAGPDAAQLLLDQLDAAGLPIHRLVLEITEAAFAQDAAVRSNLAMLRQAGARVFLDDFGVGYSSLAHLHRFSVDGLKIDAAAINPVVDERLVGLIVGVAAALGLRTVAEGVETGEQLDAVRRLGVDFAQGFLLGRPARSLDREPGQSGSAS